MVVIWASVGLFMYVFMTALSALVIQLVDGEWISQRIILIGIPIWTVAGFAVGFMAKNLNVYLRRVD
jgi:hypothetical protein